MLTCQKKSIHVFKQCFIITKLDLTLGSIITGISFELLCITCDVQKIRMLQQIDINKSHFIGISVYKTSCFAQEV